MTIFGIIVFVSGLNIILAGIAKTLELHELWKVSFAIYYLLGIGFSGVLCYVYDYGVTGIWLGWLACLLLSLFMNLKLILCLDFEETFTKMRERYKIIEAEERLSR